MRHLIFATILAATGGLALGCGGSSADEGRTVVVHEVPVESHQHKPAPAYDEEREYEIERDFDDDFEEETEYEIERDD